LGGYNGDIGKHRPTGSYRRIDIGGYPPPPQLADPQSIIVNSVPAIATDPPALRSIHFDGSTDGFKMLFDRVAAGYNSSSDGPCSLLCGWS